jgi:RNA polymerase-interacting CarD/CdnL/TRCF family regulator
MSFKVNEIVVHPQHGVGRIDKLEIREFTSGSAQMYYEISIPNGTLWVQVKGSSCGLRKLISKDDLDKYRDLLKSRPTPLILNQRHHKSELNDTFNQLSFKARCEVVRDLTAHGWYKKLGEEYATLLRSANQALYQEWAIAEGVSLSEATREVDSLLREGRQMYKE